MSAVKLDDARRVISAAENKAREIGQPMNIAVADEGGNIVAHIRMDNAWIGSIDISMKKAYTSRAFDIETIDLAKHSQSGGQFFGIHASNGRRQYRTLAAWDLSARLVCHRKKLVEAISETDVRVLFARFGWTL